jgi:hypothetical protein
VFDWLRTGYMDGHTHCSRRGSKAWIKCGLSISSILGTKPLTHKTSMGTRHRREPDWSRKGRPGLYRCRGWERHASRGMRRGSPMEVHRLRRAYQFIWCSTQNSGQCCMKRAAWRNQRECLPVSRDDMDCWRRWIAAWRWRFSSDKQFRHLRSPMVWLCCRTPLRTNANTTGCTWWSHLQHWCETITTDLSLSLSALLVVPMAVLPSRLWCLVQRWCFSYCILPQRLERRGER